MNGKRTSVEILHDILRLAKARDGEKKTRIMLDANLSYDMLRRYLAFLEGKGFVAHDARSGEFHVTGAGSTFLSELEHVLGQLQELPAALESDRSARRGALLYSAGPTFKT